jgi:hypothetical protein
MTSGDKTKLTQVGCPDQRPSKPNVIGPLDLVLEGVGIVVRDPLVVVPCHVLDGCRLVVHGRQASFLVGADDVLDFVVGEVCKDDSVKLASSVALGPP